MRPLFNEKVLFRSSLLLLGWAAFTLLFALISQFYSSREVLLELPQKRAARELRSSFLQPREAYERIGAPWLELRETPPPLLIPDLRSILLYQGMNGRPDSSQACPLLHLGLQGHKEITLASQGERLFLDYRHGLDGEEHFALTHEKRPLWMEVEPHEQEALVKVGIDLEGHPPLEPQSFRLPLKEPVRLTFGHQGWEVGKFRADGTLLARQGARWVGVDCFLERHGGEEYAELIGKQRIDFGEKEELYSVFVTPGDCLVFEEGHWRPELPGEKTQGLPLLQVKRVDERILTLDLWDPTGQKKIPLSLIKLHENWAKESLQKEFRFVGAKTRTQCVFEIGRERHLLKPHDWLVFTDGVWKKLESLEEIDAYVERRIAAPLFVFEGFVRADDHQVLMGTLFNASRTDQCQVELAIQRGGLTILPGEESVAALEDEPTSLELVRSGVPW